MAAKKWLVDDFTNYHKSYWTMAETQEEAEQKVLEFVCEEGGHLDVHREPERDKDYGGEVQASIFPGWKPTP